MNIYCQTCAMIYRAIVEKIPYPEHEDWIKGPYDNG